MAGNLEMAGLRLFQLGLVEFFPVVEVVEIDGVAEGTGIIRQAVGRENGLARLIVVNIAADGAVEVVDGKFVQLGSGLGKRRKRRGN